MCSQEMRAEAVNDGGAGSSKHRRHWVFKGNCTLPGVTKPVLQGGQDRRTTWVLWSEGLPSQSPQRRCCSLVRNCRNAVPTSRWLILMACWGGCMEGRGWPQERGPRSRMQPLPASPAPHGPQSNELRNAKLFFSCLFLSPVIKFATEGCKVLI